MTPLTILTIRAEPAGIDRYGRPAEYRLKLMLKHLLRMYGWRCVAIVDAAPATAAPATATGQADSTGNTAEDYEARKIAPIEISETSEGTTK